jgi:dolichyl-phosphate-mannose--protein O-mannosyl transferase
MDCLVPFMIMGRVTYVHHYVRALIYSINIPANSRCLLLYHRFLSLTAADTILCRPDVRPRS